MKAKTFFLFLSVFPFSCCISFAVLTTVRVTPVPQHNLCLISSKLLLNCTREWKCLQLHKQTNDVSDVLCDLFSFTIVNSNISLSGFFVYKL